MPKSRDNCLLFERNVSDEFLIKLNSLCHTSSGNSPKANDLKTHVLKLALRNEICNYEINRVHNLIKIMSKKIRIINSVKRLSFQLKSFLQCTFNNEDQDNIMEQDLIYIRNWLKKKLIMNR